MDSFIGFAGVGGAIIASMGLAMWMEWYCLRWLMRIMPGKAGALQPNLAAMETDEQAASMAAGAEQLEAKMPVATATKATRYEVRLGL